LTTPSQGRAIPWLLPNITSVATTLSVAIAMRWKPGDHFEAAIVEMILIETEDGRLLKDRCWTHNASFRAAYILTAIIFRP
jgi:hypothetical protein